MTNPRIADTVAQLDIQRNGEETPNETRLPITGQQANLLARTQAAVHEAERHFQLVGATILAGHGLDNAQLLRLEDGPVLVVRLAANGKPES